MRHIRQTLLALCVLLVFATPAGAAGNTSNDSFNRAKRILSQQVYHDNRITVYCGAEYDERGNITLPEGFFTPSHHKRAERMEWEHIVPAENFGRAFVEWREGHPECVDKNGKPFRGRRCAEKVNMEFRRMKADMHNLAPSIGAVNALRSNHSFALLPGAENTFGTCAMKIQGNRVEPPEHARGKIARTYKYMEATYPRYNMGGPSEKLKTAWDRMYPPDAWECERARRIARVQGNSNEITEARCREVGL